MPSYLDRYGEGYEQHAKRTKRIIAAILIVVSAAVVLSRELIEHQPTRQILLELHRQLGLLILVGLLGRLVTRFRLGLANHAVADPLGEAIKAAKKILELPQQAVESTKRVLNIHLERAVLATIDYALSAESQSMQTEDFRAIVAKFNANKN